MSQKTVFADVLDATEKLDDDEQVELEAVLRKRRAERGRQRIAASIEQAKNEFAAGLCKPMTAAEILREAQS